MLCLNHPLMDSEHHGSSIKSKIKTQTLAAQGRGAAHVSSIEARSNAGTKTSLYEG